MRKPLISVSIVAMLALAVWGSLAYADTMTANIQFPFKAAGNNLPAGKYQIETALVSDELTIRNVTTGKVATVLAITRLSQRGEEGMYAVFDKVGEQYYLSEIYMPGEEGFQLPGATTKHTHVKVKGSK